MFAKFSVKKPMTILVCVILVIILGVVAFTRMTPDLLPNIDLPYVMVMTSFVGASPEEIEATVTKPIEQSLATLDHIKGYQSSSSENVSIVMMEFSTDANLDAVTMNIREKLNLLQNGWSDGVGTPTILKLNPNMLPLAVYAVSREGYDAAAMTSFYRDTLSMHLEGTEGVASLSGSGLIEESVKIVLNQEKMDAINEKVRLALDEKFADGEKKLNDNAETIQESWDKLSEAQDELDDAKKKLKTAKKDIEKEFEKTEKSLTNQLTQLESTRDILKNAINMLERTPREGMATNPIIDELSQRYAELGQVETAITQISSALKALPDQEKKAIRSLYGAKDKLAEGEEQLEDTRKQLTDGEEQLDDAREQLSDSKVAAQESTDMGNLLTIPTVAGILTAQNFSMPAGYAKLGEKDCLIYVGDKLVDEDELSDMIIFDLKLDDIDPIRLSDVADVVITDNADSSYARIDGESGITVSFFKQSGYATANVCDTLLERMAELEERYPGLHFTPLMDQGDYIHLVIDSVLNSLLLGAALAIIILLIFLRDIRPTLAVALSIPISVTFAIVLMYFSGITLNVISMSGLAVGVGMLVDNSIVVIENIYRLRRKGVSVYRACISGATRVAGAITASTLTTVCVFVPIVFVEGVTRQIFADMALTIGYSLLASLIVSLTLVPAISSGVMKSTKAKPDKLFDLLTGVYKKVLSAVLHARIPAFLLAIGLLVFFTVVMLGKGFSYMPAMESAEMSVSLTMTDPDASFSELTKATDRIAARIRMLPEMKTVGAMTSGGMMSMIGMDAGTAEQMTIYLVRDLEQEGRSGEELTKVIEDICADEAVDYTVMSGSSITDYTSALGGGGVAVNVYGNNLNDLKQAAREIAERLEGIEGLIEIETGLEDAEPALRITVDKSKAMEAGLTIAEVYQHIAMFLKTDGDVAEFERSDRKNVVLTVSESAPTVEEVRNKSFTFADREGKYKTVYLKDIATFTEEETLQSVSRVNQRRTLTVSAGLVEGYNVTLQTTAAMRALEDYTPPAGVTYEFGGENETIMDAMEDLVLLLALGIVIVYLIMVAQFQSLVSPLIVMATIPLAFTGGLVGLLLSGMEISIVAMLGFVILVGVIVNNGIVLIDAMNQLRADGIPRRQAVIEASAMRVRPVLMTALTTILGLVPLAYGGSMGASLVQPVAVVSIGGLVYATFMTLFIVPAIYDLIMKKPPRVLTKEDLALYEEDNASEQAG